MDSDSHRLDYRPKIKQNILRKIVIRGMFMNMPLYMKKHFSVFGIYCELFTVDY